MNVTPRKNSIAVRFLLEDLAMLAGGDWTRKIESETRTAPTEDDWAAYRTAVAHLEAAREYEGFDEGCNCEHASIEEPHERIEYTYAETDAVWRARVQAKLDAGEWPEPRPEPSLNWNFARTVAQAVDNANTERG